MLYLMENRYTLQQQNLFLKDVITGIKNSRYVLPIIQRNYVWKEKDVIKLADSLLLGMPIQQLITMPTTGEYKIACNSLDGFEQDQDQYPTDAVYVLDGQQRLTSIGKIFLQPHKKDNYAFNVFSLLDRHFYGETENELVINVKRTKNEKYLLNCKEVFIDIVSNRKEELKNKISLMMKEFVEIKKEKDQEKCTILLYSAPKQIVNLFDSMFNTQISFCQIEANLDEEYLEEAFYRINKLGVDLSMVDLINANSYKRNGIKTNGIIDYLSVDLKQYEQAENLINAFLGAKNMDNNNNINYSKISNLFRMLHLIKHYESQPLKQSVLTERTQLLKNSSEYWYDTWDQYKEDIFKVFNWFEKEKVYISCADITMLYMTFFLVNLKVDVENINPKLANWIIKTMNALTLKGVSLGRGMIADLLQVHEIIKKYIKDQQDRSVSAANNLHLFEVSVEKEQVLNKGASTSLGKIWEFLNRTGKVNNLTSDLSGTPLTSTCDFDLHHLIPISLYKNESKEVKAKFNSIANLRLLNTTFNQQIIRDKKFKDYMLELESHNAKFEDLVKMNLVPLNWKELDDHELLKEMAKLVAKTINDYFKFN